MREKDNDKVMIDIRWQTHQDVINTSLTQVRKALYNKLNAHYNLSDEAEVPIETKGGTIILERKGIDSNYPEGNSKVYHIHIVDVGVTGTTGKLLSSGNKRKCRTSPKPCRGHTINPLDQLD